MTRKSDAASVAETLGDVLLRGNRTHLYAVLIGDSDGVDETTYPVLSWLGRLGSVTTTELAAQIGLDRTVTTRYASRLEAAGLIERRPHAADARATSLVLTRKGRRTVDRMRDRLEQLIADAMTPWPADRVRLFADSFREFADRLGPEGPSS